MVLVKKPLPMFDSEWAMAYTLQVFDSIKELAEQWLFKNLDREKFIVKLYEDLTSIFNAVHEKTKKYTIAA